jgi:hydroxymethylpyrimidine/phosphomethylpyrimidine kinase
MLTDDKCWASAERRCVLVFAGADPSGGAGAYADMQAIAAVGAHALPIVTVLTAQDNNRVQSIHAVAADLVMAQAQSVIASIPIAAVKIGLIGSRENAGVIVRILEQLRANDPAIPTVLDPIMASGHGDALTVDDAISTIDPVLPYVTLITPNLPEMALFYSRHITGDFSAQEAASLPSLDRQAQQFFDSGISHVLIKGGHDVGEMVINRRLTKDGRILEWESPRLPGSYHGSGCTLAAAIAGNLAQGFTMDDAIDQGQRFCQAALIHAFTIASGQKIPGRTVVLSS